MYFINARLRSDKNVCLRDDLSVLIPSLLVNCNPGLRIWRLGNWSSVGKSSFNRQYHILQSKIEPYVWCCAISILFSYIFRSMLMLRGLAGHWYLGDCSQSSWRPCCPYVTYFFPIKLIDSSIVLSISEVLHLKDSSEPRYRNAWWKTFNTL